MIKDKLSDQTSLNGNDYLSMETACVQDLLEEGDTLRGIPVWRRALIGLLCSSLILNPLVPVMAMERMERHAVSPSFSLYNQDTQKILESINQPIKDLGTQLLTALKARPLSEEMGEGDGAGRGASQPAGTQGGFFVSQGMRRDQVFVPKGALIRGDLLAPHVITQEQALNLLNLDPYGQSIISETLHTVPQDSIHEHFQVQVASTHTPLPLNQYLSHYGLDYILTGQVGVLPTSLITLENVMIMVPLMATASSSQQDRQRTPVGQSTGQGFYGMQSVTYQPKPYTFTLAVQPRFKGLMDLRTGLWGEGPISKESLVSANLIKSPANLGSLVVSSLVLPSTEALPEALQVEGTTINESPLFYYPPGWSLSPISRLSSGSRRTGHILEVRNALYGMPSFMAQVIDDKVRQLLPSINPSVWLLQGLTFLQSAQIRYQELLQASGVKPDQLLDLDLPLCVAQQQAVSLYQNFTILNQALGDSDVKTYQDLLDKVFPLVSLAYRSFRAGFSSPEKQGGDNQHDQGTEIPKALQNHLERLREIEDLQTHRIIPARTLEDILDLTMPLPDGRLVLESLAQEKMSSAEGYRVHSLSQAACELINEVAENPENFKGWSLCAQKSFLSTVACFFPEEAHQVEWRDQKVLTSLLYRIKDPDILNLLVDWGADAHTMLVKNQVSVPLLQHWISAVTPETQDRHLKTLETLIQRGAPLNKVSSDGTSVLDMILAQNLDLVFAAVVKAHQSQTIDAMQALEIQMPVQEAKPSLPQKQARLKFMKKSIPSRKIPPSGSTAWDAAIFASEVKSIQHEETTSLHLPIGLPVQVDKLVERYRIWQSKPEFESSLNPIFGYLAKVNPKVAWHLALKEILPPPQQITLGYEELRAIAEQHKPLPGDRVKTRKYNFILDMIDDQDPVLEIQAELESFLGNPLSNPGSTLAYKLIGADIGERSLSQDVYEQIFNEDGTVRPSNVFGRRAVAKVVKNGKILYFKHLPEFPGFEYAVGSLHNLLIGHGTPWSDLVKLKGEAFLVSSGVEGQNLQDVLDTHPDLLKQLDSKSFSESMLLTLLVNPEDDKPDNYILEPLATDAHKYRLIGVDNDHAFMPTIARESDDPRAKKQLQVKSVLYCMDQMNDPVHEEVREAFATLDPYQLLSEWLADLSRLETKYEALFTNAEAVSLAEKDCIVCLPFKEQMMTQLYDKLVRLQRLFSAKSLGRSSRETQPRNNVLNPRRPRAFPTSMSPTSISHMEVLRRLEPLLANRYKPAFDLNKPIALKDRFRTIHGTEYRIDDRQKLVSTTSSRLLLDSLDIPVQDSLILSNRRLGMLKVSKAQEELKAIQAYRDAQLLGSDQSLETFSRLSSENARATFLSRFDCAVLDTAQQQALLRSIKDSDPRSLTFKNCEALTLDIFKAFEKGNLGKLNLSGLKNIDKNWMEELSKAPSLRGLSIRYGTGLRNAIGPFSFNQITTLVMSHCENLTILNLKTPLLTKLAITDCRKLQNVTIAIQPKPVLTQVDLRHNFVLRDRAIQKLLTQHPLVTTLNVTGCYEVFLPDLRTVNCRFPIQLGQAMAYAVKGTGGLSYTQLKELVGPQIDREIPGYGPLIRILRNDPTCTGPGLQLYEINNAVGVALGEALKINTTVTSLNLKGDPDQYLRNNYIGVSGGVALGEALKINTTLTSLDLYGNQIGEPGGIALGEALKVNKTLTSLDLYGNQIGEPGGIALGEALKINTTLTSLNLRMNHIGDFGAEALGEALKTNTTLTSLKLYGNKISDSGVVALDEALKVNTTLTSLNLDGNKIDYGIEKVINSLITRNQDLRPKQPTEQEPQVIVSLADAPKSSPELKGQHQGAWVKFLSLAHGEPSAVDLFQVLPLDRGLMVQHLLAAIPLLQQEGALAQELQAAGLSDYRAYTRFVLGGSDPINSIDHAQSLKAMANLYPFSCWIWEQDQATTLKRRQTFGTEGPLYHVLATSPGSSAHPSSRSYQLLTIEDYSPNFAQVYSQPLDDDLTDIQPPLAGDKQQPPFQLPTFTEEQLRHVSDPLRHQLAPLRGSLTFLIFPPHTLTREDANTLKKLLQDHQSLTQLTLPSAGLTDEDALTWAAFLKDNTHLTSLSFVGNQFTIVGLKALMGALQHNQTLIQFNLKNNPGFEDSTRVTLDNLLSRNKGLQEFQVLQTIQPSQVVLSKLGYPGSRILFTKMADHIADFSFIHTLVLQFTPLNDATTCKDFKTYLQQAPSLTSLRLLDTSLDDQSLAILAPVFAHHPSLTSLDLRGNLLRDASTQSLAAVIATTSSLKALDIRWNRIQGEGYQSLLTSWQQRAITPSQIKSPVFVIETDPNNPYQGAFRKLSQEQSGLDQIKGMLPDSTATIVKGRVLNRASGKSIPLFKVTLYGQNYHMKEELVPGDGDCGYTALNKPREEAARMLMDQLKDPAISFLLSCEVEDSFKMDVFPPNLKRTPEYKKLKEKQAQLGVDIQKQVSLVNKFLNRAEGDKWPQDKLLEAYFTQRQSDLVRFHMQKLIELTLQEQALEEEMSAYCRNKQTIESYITSFILPSAAEYRSLHDNVETNWLIYSSHKDTEGFYRASSADAIARAMGKNLAIWTETSLSHHYHWNPEAKTLHLLHLNADHFNRLVE
ncbi:MAG: hypothetical protein K0M45_01015 [Candidatus Paracaedibacteraceae bacterium]|nr:hypothetical protein [Candidatus Paracaedibacteraceae bacterium]